MPCSGTQSPLNTDLASVRPPSSPNAQNTPYAKSLNCGVSKECLIPCITLQHKWHFVDYSITTPVIQGVSLQIRFPSGIERYTRAKISAPIRRLARSLFAGSRKGHIQSSHWNPSTMECTEEAFVQIADTTLPMHRTLIKVLMCEGPS